MRLDWKRASICIAIPLAVGGLSAWLSRGGIQTFALVRKPPLSPPAWLFPLVWTGLFLLMGTASYLVLTSDQKQEMVRKALWLYAVQLGVNFLWPVLFFDLSQYLLSFVWIILLWWLVLMTAVRFYRISRAAGYLMAPYLLWVLFAGYLNWGIYALN